MLGVTLVAILVAGHLSAQVPPSILATQQAKLTAADAAAGDFFGNSVAVAGDTVVVGSFEDGDASWG